MAELSTSHVFISYSRRDSDVMHRIVSFLRGQGLKAWVDNEKLVPGTPSWEREIEKALDCAFAIVVVLSPDAKESVWVLNELTLADEFRKRVFPVLVRGDFRESIPFRLATRQFVDLRFNEERGLEALSGALTRYLEELKHLEEQRQAAEQEIERQKQDAQRLAAQQAEEERLAKAKLEEERLAEKKTKEEADRLTAQAKLTEERLAPEKRRVDEVEKQRLVLQEEHIDRTKLVSNHSEEKQAFVKETSESKQTNLSKFSVLAKNLGSKFNSQTVKFSSIAIGIVLFAFIGYLSLKPIFSSPIDTTPTTAVTITTPTFIATSTQMPSITPTYTRAPTNTPTPTFTPMATKKLSENEMYNLVRPLPSSTPISDPESISGRVYNGYGPYLGEVRLVDSSNCQTITSTNTDQQGNYVFNDVPTGLYTFGYGSVMCGPNYQKVTGKPLSIDFIDSGYDKLNIIEPKDQSTILELTPAIEWDAVSDAKIYEIDIFVYTSNRQSTYFVGAWLTNSTKFSLPVELDNNKAYYLSAIAYTEDYLPLASDSVQFETK